MIVTRTVSPKAFFASLPVLGAACTLALWAHPGWAQQSSCGDTTTIEAGETFSVIAERCDVPVAAIEENNPDADPARLQIGQTLRLESGRVAEAETGSDAVTETHSGVLTDEGVECQALRAIDGQLFTLVGDLGEFGEGDLVEVEGAVAEMSTCQQGTTIEIHDIRHAPA